MHAMCARLHQPSRYKHHQPRGDPRSRGGIPPLVALLSAGAESKAAVCAAGTLMNKTDDNNNKEAIREAGGIPPLVSLLGAGA